MLKCMVDAEIATRDEQIADANRMIGGKMIEILEKLQADPEANITEIINLMLAYDSTRRTAIWEKTKILGNECERYETRAKAAGID